MSRIRLPDRRQNVTRDVQFRGRPFAVTVGLDADWRPLEVFAGGHHEGSEMQAILDDACIIISIALQMGASRENLAKSLGRAPVMHRGKMAEDWVSVIGVIVAAIPGPAE